MEGVVITINGSNEAPTNAGDTIYTFNATGTVAQTILDQGGGDRIMLDGTGATLSNLGFERVGSDLVMQLGSQQVTVTNQYGSTANTVETIEFSAGQNYYGYQLVGEYTLLTTQDPGNGNANWVLAGGSGTDSLTGGSNNNQKDLIFGNASGDTLTGRTGYDLLVGGAGDDKLLGDDGNDTLIGGAGNDILTGGAGSDTFVFNTALNANLDRVTDFNANATDILWLSKAVFSGLATVGAATGSGLDAGDFLAVASGGATADMGSAHILYDRDTGALYYDANGGKDGGRVQFATLDDKPSGLDASDFKVGL